MFALLQQAVSRGKSVVMVTHNQQLAQRCDVIIKMRDGKIVS